MEMLQHRFFRLKLCRMLVKIADGHLIAQLTLPTQRGDQA